MASNTGMDTQSVHRLHAYTSELLEVPDAMWARGVVGSLHAGTTGELNQMIATANRMASEHWAWLLERQRDDERLQPTREVERHGVRVLEEAPGLLDGHYIHFAMFEPTAKAIHVSIASVKAVMECLEMAELSQVLGPVSVLDVVLWHEYFHVWSHVIRQTADKHAPRRWRFGRSKRQVPLQRTMEELAAVEFSRQAGGLKFHPQLLQWLLIYTKDPRRARELVRNVLGKSW